MRGIKTRGHVNLARSVLRAAVDMRVLPKLPDVPASNGPGKKLPHSPARDEVEQMVEHGRDWLRTAIVLAFYQGSAQESCVCVFRRDPISIPTAFDQRSESIRSGFRSIRSAVPLIRSPFRAFDQSRPGG